VAKSAQGKLVSRVGASGGGKTYKKTRPVNFYGAITIIVVLGLSTVLYSRYEYQHPAGSSVTSTTVAGLTLGTTSYVGLASEACGVVSPYFASSSPTSTASYHVLNSNVVRAHPTTLADAGANATVAKLASAISGLTLSTNKLVLPTASGQGDPMQTYTTGSKCPTGTKYAGQVGRVVVAYWKSGATLPAQLATDPTMVPLSSNLLVTLAFEPASITPQPPTSATIHALLLAQAAATTTTTINKG
jgi:hypothetical protein